MSDVFLANFDYPLICFWFFRFLLIFVVLFVLILLQNTFVHCSFFFFWTLYCLSLSDSQLLITPLVYSNYPCIIFLFGVMYICGISLDVLIKLKSINQAIQKSFVIIMKYKLKICSQALRNYFPLMI